MKASFCDWCGNEIIAGRSIPAIAPEREYCSNACATNALQYDEKDALYRAALSSYMDKGGLGRLHKTFDEYLAEQGIERVDDRKVERKFRE